MPFTGQSEEADATHTFFIHADRMIKDAQFIVDSLPNTEISSVECALRQLHAIHLVLINLDDEWLEEEEIGMLIQTLCNHCRYFMTHHPLRITLVLPLSHQSSFGGRPKYNINLHEALRLHSLGNSWESISEAMGVSRRTMYYHLQQAGLSTAR